MRRTTKRVLLALAGLLACWPAAEKGGGGSTSGGVGSTSGVVTSTSAVTTTSDTGVVGGASEGSEVGTATDTGVTLGSGGILPLPDVPVEPCNLFTQNCPAGMKCMPYSSDGGSWWNSDKCVPVVEDPQQFEEPCHAEGGGVSGIDDCDFG